MNRQRIHTTRSYISKAHLSQAYRVGDLVFTAGIGPLVPGTNAIPSDDIEVQARQVLENLKAILEAAGSSLSEVIKVTVFLRNLQRDFPAFERVWKSYFPTDPPARITVQAELGHPPADGRPGMHIELDAIAVASGEVRVEL